MILGLTLPANAGPVVGEALQTLALDWGEATNGHGANEGNVATACAKLGGDRRGDLKRARDSGVLGVVFVDSTDHRVRRACVAEVKVVQRVAGVGRNPRLVVGRRASAL